MPIRQIEGISKLSEHIGQEVGLSDWFEVTQELITQFAHTTHDVQWIHVEPDRAARESPYGTTIAHGFLTLSLLPLLSKTAIAIDGVRMAINYGLNRVRFTAPVHAGARVRGRFVLASLDKIPRGVQATWNVSVERDGSDRPCCVAEWLARYYQ
ncbi:MAG TPA: MaoC family dehydratase [Acidobacteriota bacterium]|jgi:acyl dehydratase